MDLSRARKVNNYEIDATGTTALWPNDKEFKAEVPPGKRWWVLGGLVNRDVSSTLNIEAYDTADDDIVKFMGLSAGTGLVAWPSTNATTAQWQFSTPFPLDAGEYILITFGTSQTGAAYASCVVLEIDI